MLIIIIILDSLEEARGKLRTASYKSDLSSTEDEKIIKCAKKKLKLQLIIQRRVISLHVTIMILFFKVIYKYVTAIVI